MPESQVGTVAVVWGIPGSTYTVDGASLGSGIAWLPSEMSWERTADQEETRDEDGDVVNVCTYNGQETMSLTVYPNGTTLANATTANYLPAPGSRVGIIGTDDPQVQTTTPGRQYLVVSATKTPSTTGKTMFSLQLKRWDGISSYTPLA